MLPRAKASYDHNVDATAMSKRIKMSAAIQPSNKNRFSPTFSRVYSRFGCRQWLSALWNFLILFLVAEGCCIYLTNILTPVLGGPYLFARLSLSHICPSLPCQLLSSFRPSVASEDMAISPDDHSLGNAIHRGSLWRHRGTFQILRCY